MFCPHPTQQFHMFHLHSDLPITNAVYVLYSLAVSSSGVVPGMTLCECFCVGSWGTGGGGLSLVGQHIQQPAKPKCCGLEARHYQ